MTNLEIAQSVKLRRIADIAEQCGLSEADFEPLGNYKGKLTYEGMDRLRSQQHGKLILVTALTPTPAGEGKTTTCVGLAQALNRAGKSALPALREPALGPVFGIKGGAAGGGYSQVLPMEDINLFFTGDFPAICAAHNLLSAVIDASIMHGNPNGLDVRNISWPRTVDMNDRALRSIVVGLGGLSNGYPRQDGFVVAPASEVMAVLCLAKSIDELKLRLGNVIVGLTPDKRAVTARDLKASGAMAALLRDAIRPNLVQTIEGGPAFIHGGPFGNIAHGCSSVVATQCALGLSDYVVTEAGFGADLGAEKFMNIVTRELGRSPNAIVLVVTVRAIEHHGDGDLVAGFENVRRHISHLKRYGVPITVAINEFHTDSRDQHEQIRELCRSVGVSCITASPWLRGGDGCLELAEQVISLCNQPTTFKCLYETTDSEETKLNAIVKHAYGGDSAEISAAAEKHLEWAETNGFPDLPICVAKTQYSLSADPKIKGAPEGFTIKLRDVTLSAGAGFLVAHAGDILLMPGLGKSAAAERIDVDGDGKISGLF
jgi:formate--tetrahydrofolate ligase